MTLTLVIGSRRYSSWSLRPWLALKRSGQVFETVEIALRQPGTKAEILKYSPSGQVPLLMDGSLKVWDSLAICEYLAERFPDAHLWPAEAKARALARSVSAEMHSGFMPLRRDCPMDVLLDAPETRPGEEVLANIARIEALWADLRARFGAAGPYLFGKFSIADAMYAPVATRIRTYHLPMGKVAATYAETLLGMPEMAEWIAGAA